MEVNQTGLSKIFWLTHKGPNVCCSETRPLLAEGVDHLWVRIIEITGIPRHQPRLMMQRSRSEETVDGGGRSPYLWDQPAPAIGYGKANRKYPALEPPWKVMLEPKAQLLVVEGDVAHNFHIYVIRLEY